MHSICVRFVTPEDEREQKRHGGDGTEAADVSESQEPREESEKSRKKKPQWNNRLAPAPPLQGQPTVTSWRRYEAELSHAPAVTSTEQIYKAYVGRTKEQLRDETLNDNNSDGQGKQRPSTSGTAENDDGEEPDPRSRKEYFLTRNEAKMYIHLQNVYGSEAFRQQRKEWFFKRLTDVQLQELKQQAEERRRRQQRKEESKRRQQRQLAYVRRKFRREQLHRFRTQYVTSRVLEYEKADRDLYGLPDSDDEDGGGYGDGTTDRDKNTSETPSEDNSNKKGSKGDANGFMDSSNKSKPPEKKESVKGTSGDQHVKDDEVSGARAPHTGPTEAPHGSAGTERDSNSKAADSETHASLSKSSQHEISRDQLPNTRDNTSKPVPKSKLTDSNTTASKVTNNVNKTLPPSDVGGGSDQSHSKTSKTTPASSQAMNSSHTDDSGTVQPASSNNTVKNGNGTKKEDSLTKDRLSATEPNSVKQKQDSERVKASKNPDKTVSSENNVAEVKQKTPTTTNNEKGKHDTWQKANETTLDKNAKNQATSAAKNTVPATKSTTADAKNTSTQAEQDSSSSLAPKTTSPTAKESQAKSKPAAADSNGMPSKGRDHTVDDGPGKRTTITKDAKGRYFTTTRTFGPQDPQSNAEPNSSSPNDREVNGQVSKVKDSSSKRVSNNKVTAGARQTSREGQAGKDTQVQSPANQQTHSRGRKQKPTHAQPKSEAEQKKQLERKYGKLFDVKTGPSWDPGAKPPKMEGIDTVYVRVTDEKGQEKCVCVYVCV